MAGKFQEHKVRCSFCNKSEDQVRKLIAGPEGVYICDDCIEICQEILEEEMVEDDYEIESHDGIHLLQTQRDQSISG